MTVNGLVRKQLARDANETNATEILCSIDVLSKARADDEAHVVVEQCS